MTRLPAAVFAPLLMLAAVPALAQEGPPPGGPGPRHLAMALRSVDLSSRQDARIRSLLEARHDAAKADRRAAEDARRALGDRVCAEKFDEAAIRAAAAALASFEADRAVADAALLREIRAELAPGQRETFDKMMSPPPRPGFRGREGEPDAR